jgi:SAM-dependent methyltransferase
MSGDVQARERDFHNRRFGAPVDPRAHLDKWYAAVRHGAAWQDALVRAEAAGRDVLEYGCADGTLALDRLDLPRVARSVTGIDISDVAIDKARERAGGAANARFLTMDAEAMTFADASFDLVYGRGILHHLDLARSLAEIARVLRPGGIAAFCEPMGHNPILNAYRRRTPDLRSADEHPLTTRDLDRMRAMFARVDTTFYGLASAASALMDARAQGWPYRVGKAIDDVILRAPAIGRYAWHCLIVCRKAA